MAGNSWQQPVAGEPSLGTLHKHFNAILGVDPGDTNWHAVDCSGQVPVGCKAIQVSASLTSAGGVRNVKFSSASAGDEDMNIHMSVTGQRQWGDGVLYLDSSYQFWYQVDNADVSNLLVRITGYFI